MVTGWPLQHISNPTGGNYSGVVHIYHRTAPETWNYVGPIVASETNQGDTFGSSVAMDGTWMAIGAEKRERDGQPSNSEAGAVYLFERVGNSWIEQQRVTGSLLQDHDNYGWPITLSGTRLVIGASAYDAPSRTGRVYVFEYDGSSWTETQTFTASDAGAGDGFGSSLSLRGDTLLVGAPGSGTGGAAYLYQYNGNLWQEGIIYTQASNSGADQFGFEVLLLSDVALIGAPFTDPSPAQDVGSLYVMDLN
ncbi:MAG: FG-GAP repeat protein [Myxococcales bacterium]|nr:MAG: FG-GAP repeat protein [Myxococcales bacterium]